MAWTVINIDKNIISRGTPTASIGFGRIALNVAACELIENFEDYKFVELLTDNERPSLVALRFLIEPSKNCLPVKGKLHSTGTGHTGITIYSRPYSQKLFGIKGTQQKTTSCKVTLEGKNILVINSD